MDLPDAVAVLTRTPLVVENLVNGLPPEWVERNDGPGTWSAYDIVGHLLNGDRTDWVARVRLIVEHGTDREFAPVARDAMLGWERTTAADLVAKFRAARQACLDELAGFGLTAADLERRGRHPVFGEVTLGQLIATWAAHDLTHVAQAAEVLARRYRDDVGPWRAYLPALERTAEAE